MDIDVLMDGLSEDLVCFVEFVGVDLFVDICDRFGGCQIYFPKKESIYRGVRNESIRSMYNGVNAGDIAREFGITKKHVENIVKYK